MIITEFGRRAASLIAAGSVAALLAGCVVSSETSLVSPDEGVAVLPATFAMVTYAAETEDGPFIRSNDEPGVFTLRDGGYVIDDDSMTAYFTRMGDPTHYLITTVASDGAMYGAATIGAVGIMEIRMVFSDDISAAPDGLSATAIVSDGGIVVDNRADVDLLFKLIASGTLATEPLLAYVGDGEAPATLVKDGNWYKAGD